MKKLVAASLAILLVPGNVRTDPAMVTRIIIPFEGYPGKYVWHCHILEHEDNEMMRPYEVLPTAV